MKKIFLPLSILFIAATSFTISTVKAGNEKPAIVASMTSAADNDSLITDSKMSARDMADALYTSLELNKVGLKKEAVETAYQGFQHLVAKGAVSNPDILTIADFSQSSDNKRLYIIDLKNNKLLINTYVAHGKNSGVKMADKFSNTMSSLQSSLGFYVTRGTYTGKHGLSLRLDGMDKGFNDNAMARAIVVHGATYIGDSRKGAAFQGRSFGCPAVPQEYSQKVINLIKDGSTLFIYKPDAKYMNSSKVLNG